MKTVMSLRILLVLAIAFGVVAVAWLGVVLVAGLPPTGGTADPAGDLPWHPTPITVADPSGYSDRVVDDLDRYVETVPEHVVDVLHWSRVTARSATEVTRVQGREELFGILDHNIFAARYPQSRPLVRATAWGGWEVSRIPMNRSFTPDELRRLQGEYHTDQLLAACGETGLPLSTGVSTQSGHTLTLNDLIASARAAFVSGQEWEWSTVAFCAYRPHEHEWANRFGERYSYNQLADELAGRSLNAGSCSGTHKLYALCCLLQLDANKECLSDAVRDRVIQHLRQASELLVRTQQPNGSWGANWAGGEGWGEQRHDIPQTLSHITAHHLEWLLFCPHEHRPPDDCVVKAQDLYVEICVNNE